MNSSSNWIFVVLGTFAALTILSAAHVQLPRKSLDSEWGVFVKEFGKSYKDANEELKRRLIWESNLDFIEKHAHSNSSFQMKMNQFGDLTFEEFKKMISSVKPSEPSKAQTANLSNIKAPDSIDWRTSGCVSPAVDEGPCGANWAFGVVGAIESNVCLNTETTLTPLSVQQLIDCTYNSGNQGCQGGYFRASYDYFVDNGIEPSSAYPYDANVNSCVYDKSHVRVWVKSYVRILTEREDLVQTAVGTIGPVTAGVYVTSAFQFYSGGIFYDPTCLTTQTDLGGLIVGYGSLGTGKDYFIFRNSWGRNWGVDGYIFMARNRGNNCGIATDCYYPVFN